MQFDLTVLPGDGVGPEVTSEAVKVLQAAGKKFGHDFNLHYGLIGGVVPSGTTLRIRSVLKMAFWGCESRWVSLLICVR